MLGYEILLAIRHIVVCLTKSWRIRVIRCHLARLMGEHKMRISDVIRETGLSRNTITLMYKETAQKMDLEALDKLCVLFNCEVQDLLQKEPQASGK